MLLFEGTSEVVAGWGVVLAVALLLLPVSVAFAITIVMRNRPRATLAEAATAIRTVLEGLVPSSTGRPSAGEQRSAIDLTRTRRS